MRAGERLMTMLIKLFARLMAIVVIAFALAMPAKAATSIFASSVFSTAGAVVNAGGAVGPANGAAAELGTGGDIVLSFATPLNGETIELNLLPFGVPGAVNIIAISIGEVIGGIATFSSEILLLDMGVGGVIGADLTTACAGLSAAGCSLIRVRNVGALFGSPGLSLDGVSAITTAPEPSAWALMILSFAAVGWRMKTMRKSARKSAAEKALKGNLSGARNVSGIAFT